MWLSDPYGDGNFAIPSKALTDLAELSHKWDCLTATRRAIQQLRSSIVRRGRSMVPPDATPRGLLMIWTPYHDTMLSFFLEDAKQF